MKKQVRIMRKSVTLLEPQIKCISKNRLEARKVRMKTLHFENFID